MKVADIKSSMLDLARCHNCGIREGALCSSMTDDEFNRFSSSVEDIQYPAGTFLFRQEADGQHMFSLRQGMVKLTRLRQNGDQRIMRILRPGDVGGLEVIVAKKYEYDAVALDSVLACRIPVEVIHQMDSESPQLHKKLLEKWHKTLHEADEWMAELTAGSARARLARLLLKMRNPVKPELSTLFSRDDIGSMLCMKMETASRTISAFQREGKITSLDATGRFYRVNAAALESEVQNEE